MRRSLPTPAYRLAARGKSDLRRVAGRNPGRGRLLPDFVVIGVAKGGTTSLYSWLIRHPYIAPAALKEPHYFDYNYWRGQDWYRSLFPSQEERARFTEERGHPFLTGEASPSYISHHWAPERLAQMLPTARLIVTLRNPVDRAYSHFQMSRRDSEEPLTSFAEAIEAEEERLAPELRRSARDRGYNSWPIGCWSYLMRGRYVEQLERWLALFDRSQFHFLTLEQLSSDPQRALDGLHEFLGLPPHRYDALPHLHAGAYDPLEPGLRRRLEDHFEPFNRRLYELLDMDFGWSPR